MAVTPRAVPFLALFASACTLLFPTREADDGPGGSDGGTSGALVDAPLTDTNAPPENDGGPGASTNEGPSCAGLAKTCATERSCCENVLVAGGDFKRSFDDVGEKDPSFPATVSSFRLDRFEVTVGRFRKFFAAVGPATKPAAGRGAHPKNAETGWPSAFDGLLAGDAAALKDRFESKCAGSERRTWTDVPGGDARENLPINCVTWADAFAFCIWDGGRLPTEAEWNYAAAGGNEQRVHPWSSPPNETAIGPEHAVFAATAPQPVGSKAAGGGRFGQLDLAGNLAEWTRDFDASYETPCNDCAKTGPAGGQYVVRGGAFDTNDVTALRGARRERRDPLNPHANVGIRCARDP